MLKCLATLIATVVSSHNKKMSQLDVKDHSRLYSGSSNWNFQRETIPIAEDRVSERVGLVSSKSKSIRCMFLFDEFGIRRGMWRYLNI